MTAEKLILKYWRSWQGNADFDEMEGCLAANVEMDMGVFRAGSSREFRAIAESQPEPWSDVQLVDSLFSEAGGSLVYEGTHSGNGRRMRVAEVLRVKDDKIVQISGVITELPPR